MASKTGKKQVKSGHASESNVGLTHDDASKRSFGARLRELRQQRGLSIAKLAAEVEITSGLISQVENGRADPSFTTLRRLARTLRVPLFYLFINEPLETKVRNSADRFRLNTQHGGVEYEFISDPNDTQVEFTTVHAGPGCASGDGMDSHPGRECALVLQGRMELEIEKDRYKLGLMESITFDALKPHQWKNIGKGNLRFISVTSLPFLT